MRFLNKLLVALLLFATPLHAQTIQPSGGGGGSGGSASVNPAPNFYPYPAQGDLYAKFTQPTQSYYSPTGGATATFSTWLASVSGTFTRAGTVAPLWTSGGLLSNGSANTPRLSYDPVTLVPNMLYEPAASNLVTFSQQAGTLAVWGFSNQNVTQVSAAATGLDGATSASTIRETTTNGTHLTWWRDAGISLTSGAFYAYQIYLKPINRMKMLVTPSTMGSNTAFYIDFTNVTVTDSAWSIELLSNGFYKLYKTFAANASAVPYLQFQTVDANSSLSFAGSTAAGWNLGGAQLETVASLSSPPTTYMQRPTGTAVTRNADALAFTLPASASSLTYTFANGRTQVVTVSPGAYSVPTTLTNYQIASFIDVDLTQVAAPVLSVAGRTGNVTLQQSDISGLKTTDIGRFSGLATSGTSQTFGTATFSNGGSLFQWTNGGPTTQGSAARLIVIGSGSGTALAAGGQTNTLIIGVDAAKVAAAIPTSTIVGDTATGSATTITGVSAFGNEAGNALSITNSEFYGNLAGKGPASTHVRVSAFGQNSLTFNSAIDTLAAGNAAGQGLGGTPGAINQSVLLGSQTANTLNAGSTVTNLILVGYNIQPPTSGTSNWLNIGNAIRGDLAGGTYSVTTQAGGDASFNSAIISTKAYTVATLPAAATAGAGARGFVTDAVACTLGGALTGGAATPCPVYSTGSAWLGG